MTRSVEFSKDSLRFRCPDGHFTKALGRYARPIAVGAGWEFADQVGGPYFHCTQPITINSWSDEHDAPSAESSTTTAAASGAGTASATGSRNVVDGSALEAT